MVMAGYAEKKKSNSINFTNQCYCFRVEPFGDNLGISIFINKEPGTYFREEIIKSIQRVADAYHPNLKTEE